VSDGIVIAGGGLAAQRCTETLRAQGYDGAIRIVCGEPHPPYDRPPLSKELLTGDLPEGALALRPTSWYEERRVDLLLGIRALGLDPVRRELELSRGRPLRFDAFPFLAGFVEAEGAELELFADAAEDGGFAAHRGILIVGRMTGT